MFLYIVIIILNLVIAVYPDTKKYTGTPYPKIPCYDCVIPWSLKGGEFSSYCNESTKCRGVFCYRGPQESADGIALGCIQFAPIHRDVVKGCQTTQSRNHGPWQNCYCRNNYLCNGSTSGRHLQTIVFIFVFLFAYL